jgi:transketolase
MYEKHKPLDISQSTPTVLVLDRQNLTVKEGTDFAKVAKGAYVVYEAEGVDTILLATGSEVKAVNPAKELERQGIEVRGGIGIIHRIL